jgi:hypothetical protein
MSLGLGIARIIVLLFGATMVLFGLAIMAAAGRGTVVTGLWITGIGIALIIGALIERIRYRSDATDRRGDPAGAAGGEPPGTNLEPRFVRSDEVFVDPTSGQRMRVWLDPTSGERRYLADEAPGPGR